MKIHPDMGISLPDGTRLSARVWLPDGADSEPVPAILEYLPYRKSDGTAARDHGMHLHFARHGYACVRVDRRGCGDSEGLFDDEYSEEELQDGVDIIKWIAAQPWCTGRVGIQGISWGGFNGVQIAARAPDALKAVITIGTTADRYHNDIHYKGGIQLSENIGWAATVSSWFSMPPDPEIRPNWRELWLDRLENAPFLASRWCHHADRDAYWKHGSICEDYGAIKAPVLVMGGLHDGYRNAMAMMVDGITSPVKGITGPWSHKYPNITTIGPAIDYLGEALRWWDHWLKDEPTDVDNDPAYRAYIMDSIAPDADLDFRPGRWIEMSGTPTSVCDVLAFPLGNGVLGQKEAFQARIEPDLSCGRATGEFFTSGFGPGEKPDNQLRDDAVSLCYDSAPTDATLDLVGAARVSLHIASDKPHAQIAVRLCDVRPDGTSALISMGLLNLRHRDGFETKSDLMPGEVYPITVDLDQMAYNLPAGHRLRVAISSSYWPFCWPERDAATLTITEGNLRLPVLKEGGTPCSFDPPLDMEARRYRQLSEPSALREWREDPETGHMILEVYGSPGKKEDLENGLITDYAVREIWSIKKNDPTSAEVKISWARSLGRGDWSVSSNIVTRMRGSHDHFEIWQHTQVFEGKEKVFERTESETVPR